MSFFKRLLGFKKSRSQILDEYDNNGVNESLLGESNAEETFDCTFVEAKLGAVLGRGSDGFSYIVNVEPDSQAYNNNIYRGDRIVAIDGQQMQSHEEVLNTLKAGIRPVTITFYRSESNMKEIIAISNSSSGPVKGAVGATNGTQSSASKLELEKQQRRELMANAAKERQQTWGKRVASASSKQSESKVDMYGKPLYDHSVAASIGSENLATQRAVQAARRGEVQQANNLGYDPYRPNLSYSGQPAAANSSSTNTTAAAVQPTITTSTSTVTISSLSHIIEDEGMAQAVDDAFALLLSGAADGLEDRVNACLATVLKLLSNLLKNKGEAKFRSIRLNNEGFQNKVVQVSGGLEVYTHRHIPRHTTYTTYYMYNIHSYTICIHIYLQLILSAGFLIEEGEGSGSGASSELYLRHQPGHGADDKLGYTVRRYRGRGICTEYMYIYILCICYICHDL